MSDRESDSYPSGCFYESSGKVSEVWARSRGNAEGAFEASGALLSTFEDWREANDFDSEASLVVAMPPEKEGHLTYARHLS